MATATEISTRALRRLGVVDALSSPASADVDAATEALTAMINSWEAEGLSGDVLPLDARFEQGVTAMLAVRLAEEYGKQPGAVLLRDAERGWDQLSSAFFPVARSQFESALKYTGHSTDFGYIIGEEPDGLAPWRANTDYPLRTFVINEANVYECIGAGVSASSGGPTGTEAEIFDGTVIWVWRRVSG